MPNANPLTASFQNIRNLLRPQMRQRFFHEKTRLARDFKDPRDRSVIPHRVVGEHVAINLAVEHPGIPTPVTDELLVKWDVQFDECIEIALQNLREQCVGTRQWREPSPGLFVSAWQDGWDAVRILLAEIIQTIDVCGTPVVAIPDQRTVLVTGDEDPKGLESLAELTKVAFQTGEYPLLTQPFILRRGHWDPFIPGFDHSIRREFQRLHNWTEWLLYNRQTRILRKLPSIRKHRISISNFSEVSCGDEEAVACPSVCSWHVGRHAYLPRTEFVFVFDLAKSIEQGPEIGTVRWPHFEEVVGDRMRRLDMYPERYEIFGDLSDRQLAMLEIGTV